MGIACALMCVGLLNINRSSISIAHQISIFEGQGHDEFRALSRLAAGSNTAAVAFGDLAADRQADAGTLIFVACVQSLENLKDFGQVFLLEPDAVVFHGDNAAPFLSPCHGARDFNHRRLTWAVKLECVPD